MPQTDRCTGTKILVICHGHDLFSLKYLEDHGYTYTDKARNDIGRDAEAILANGGMNAVGLRLFVNPPDGVYSLDYTLDLAQRMQTAGHRLLLNIPVRNVRQRDISYASRLAGAG